MQSQQRGRDLNWKSPFEWTDEEVHELVIKELGYDADVLFATGFKVLLKMWVPPKMRGDLHIPDTLRKNDMSVVGKVIGLGGDAFTDEGRFPSGPWCTYGDWVVFRPYEDQKLQVCGEHLVTLISDERVQCTTNAPDKIKTALKIEEEYRGVGG